MTDVADPHSSRALLIGVGAYETLTPLPAVAHNLTDLAGTLRDPQRWGLPPDRCVQLPDPADAVDVSTLLDELAGQPLDTLFVYFAGHGLIDQDTGELVLATGRTTARRPLLTGLRYGDVRDILRPHKARRLFLVLDCCFSGRATGVMADPSSLVIGQLPIEGTYVLASSGATKPSLAFDGRRHTAFTGGLLQVMTEGVPSGSPFLTPGDLFTYTRWLMVGRSWPEPTQSHENSVQELRLMRNPWSGAGGWFSWLRQPAVRARTHASDLVVGIHVGVSAVRPAFGPAGPDSLAALDAARDRADRRWLPGMDLVRDVMAAMRREYGDGAATAAILVGELLSAIHEAVERGHRWDEVVNRAGAEATAVLGLLPGPSERRTVPSGEVSSAVTTALGKTPEGDLVMSAVRRVGAHRVELVTGFPDADARRPGLSFVSRLTVATSVLVPNSAARPLTLHEPHVIVVPDGDVPVEELQGIGWRQPAPLLVITPRADSFAVSALHTLFAGTVVMVSPTDPAPDWAALCAWTGEAARSGGALGRATRALVTPSSTTVTGLPGRSPADCERGRVHAGPAGTAVHATTVRALAVARSAARLGLLPGGATGLYRAGRALEADRGGLFSAALAAPLRQLVRNAGQDEKEVLPVLDAAPATSPEGFEYGSGTVTDLRAAGVLDPVATVRGAVENAVAMISRYVAALSAE